MTLNNIFPTNHPPKKEYLVTLTEEISKFVIKNYHDTFDPTIQYSDGTKAHIGWSARVKMQPWGSAEEFRALFIITRQRLEKWITPN